MMNAMTAQFSTYLTEHGRTERTAAAYRADVERYVGWCERQYGQDFSVSMLNRSDLHDYQVFTRKQERAKAATWNRYVASLAVFAAWLRETGEIDYNPVDALTRAGEQALAPKSLSESEYRRMRLAVLEDVRTARSEAGKRQALRNAAMFTLMADAGLREGELVHLRVQDVLLGERKGRVIICDAKGNKDRSVPLDKDSVDTIKAWLGARPSAGRDEMFIGKRGDILQERGIQKVVGVMAGEAGIGHVTPHQLRHTFGYRLFKRGVPLQAIAELMGHSSIEITRRYTMPHWSDLENAIEVA